MKKISLVLVLVMLLSVIGFGCSNDSVDEPKEDKAKDTLVIGSGFDIDGMDPHGTGSLVSMKIITNIYDTLFKVDTEGNISPQLVENWEESGDKLTYSQNQRIFSPIDRASYKWGKGYKKRTAVERVNGRIDEYFGFEKIIYVVLKK